MKREAVLHIPLSNYAHGRDENHLVFRLRAARNDLRSCVLSYGDRACRQDPVIFTSIAMKRIAWDELFDYFEAEVESPYTRICYYFELNDGEEKILYYADKFTTKHVRDRSEYYQLPFNRREDIAAIPAWVKDAVVYNIFPDSFATGKKFISRKNVSMPYDTNMHTHSLNGGTISGIRENLDYLQDLGVTCIYINPIFAAEEYHKYDLIDYFSIDPCFGKNKDFEELVNACHKMGIKVIIDGVFNHCSWHFFAFEDVVRNGEKSKYVDWFYGLKFPVIRPGNMADIPGYDCFAYERKMPKMNTSNPEVLQYFLKVCRYWLEEYHIDGWRLDVASEVDFNFWREFRKTAKEVNPECFMIGEVWESAGAWLRGDQFDSTMNYDFRNICRDFFAESTIDAAAFNGAVTNLLIRYRKNISYGQLNLLDSHDVSRFYSLCGEDKRRMKLAVLFQMTFVGVPSVFYGDEQELAGVKEMEYRQPMKWEEDCKCELYSFYKELIRFRKESKPLTKGEFSAIQAIRNSGLYAYERTDEEDKVMVILNASDKEEKISSVCTEGFEIMLSGGFNADTVKPWGYVVLSNCLLQ